jgi:hypothetical protein
MKADIKTLRAVIQGDLQRPRRIELEDPSGSPMPLLDDRRYMAVGTALVPYEPQKRVEDGMKAVRISQEAYERLRAERRRGETTSQAAERLIYQEKSSG